MSQLSIATAELASSQQALTLAYQVMIARKSTNERLNTPDSQAAYNKALADFNEAQDKVAKDSALVTSLSQNTTVSLSQNNSEINAAQQEANQALKEMQQAASFVDDRQAIFDKSGGDVNSFEYIDLQNARTKLTEAQARYTAASNKLVELRAGSDSENEPVTAAPDTETRLAGIVTNRAPREYADFAPTVFPKPNTLSKFSSSSYTISIYLLTTDMLIRYTSGENIFPIPTANLLLQSGGAKKGAKNQFFNHDFFIDNLEIEVLASAKASQSPVKASNIKFDIIEPYGVTFLDRLKMAVQQIGDNAATALSRSYLLAVRFYGYDKHGRRFASAEAGNFNDQQAVLERYIAFTFTSLKFRVGEGVTTYSVVAVPWWQHTALGQTSASVQTNVEFTAVTVQSLLGATVDGVAVPVQQGISRTKTFVEQMNEYIRANTPEGTIPNEIAIDIVSGFGIETAALRKPGPLTKASSGQNQIPEPYYSMNENTSRISPNERKYSFSAGKPYIQVIQEVIDTSEYILNQSTITITESADGIKAVPKSDAAEETMWYNVSATVVPLGPIDPNTKAYPTKTTYTITPFKIGIRSQVFRRNQFRGVHKRYNYWFTGQNSEVINFEQTYNMAYQQNMWGGLPEGSTVKDTSNEHELTRLMHQRKSDKNLHGGLNDSMLPAADAASYLYSISDVASAKLTILGDPDWLGVVDHNSTPVNYKPFNDDGSLNYDSSEVLFAVTFNLPVDYSYQTGLMDVTADNYVSTGGNLLSEPAFNIIYSCVTIKNKFKDGVFTQEIAGVLKQFPNEEVAAKLTNQTVVRTPPSNNSGSTVVTTNPRSPQEEDDQPPPGSSSGVGGSGAVGGPSNGGGGR